jgi:hypothetical protein
MACVLDAISLHRAGRLICSEAGELLGLSERHFRCLRDAFEERGEDGLIDRRRGRVSARAADEAVWVTEMFRTLYFDFRMKLFHGQIVGMPMVSGNTVRYNGLVLQIPASRDRYHFAKATIRGLEYHDGRIALFHGPRKIARFFADGSLDEGEANMTQWVA